MWNWYQAGHWPSGFTEETDDYPAGMDAADLNVPRRLLAY